MWKPITVVIIITLIVVSFSAYTIFNNLISAKAPSQLPAKYSYLKPQTVKPTRTIDEMNALLLPSGATEDEKKKRLEFVIRRSKSADYLNIGKCFPGPYAMKLRYKSNFLVKNPSPKNHTIHIDQTHVYEIPANGQLTITADFGQKSGVYAYYCDNSLTPVGFFTVSQ